ncbi:PLP-dependent aminotransferase family protein [Natranaerofaba carboxydovora]|uniref:aminotransferase-like domain-containing protein n=1 Tax=Natranaerofaba carboxydovora TaxID=2742683 RepID=UPI001F13FF1F|nr:PLP-dependent aminotransferase family protein [Natranaerofaba carboxydovora]UMZ74914.1 2-aminoadipate transaminase [Natranaerofaba carboxydovora]
MSVNWEDFYSSLAGRKSSGALAEIFKLTERPDIISFAGGFPAEDMYLVDEAREIMEDIMARKQTDALGYSPTPGFSELREYIAGRQTGLNMKASMNNIVVTSGSSQGVDLVCQAFIDRGERVMVEAPTFLGTISTLSNHEAKIEPISMDEEGLNTDELEEKLKQWEKENNLPKALYTIPTFQNPSGRTLSLERRKTLLNLASKYNFIIFEDYAYGELRFKGETLPTLKELDQEGRVIFLGSFSKILSPGARIGFIQADEKVVDKIILIKQSLDQCSNSPGQYLILEFGKRGLIERQIERTVDILKDKSSLTMELLEENFKDIATWTKPEGGFFTWLILPEEFDSEKALPLCVDQAKVAYVAGSTFFLGGEGKNNLRLCFSEPLLSEIREGMPKLKEFLVDVMEGKVKITS